jgi:hypothetical protein
VFLVSAAIFALVGVSFLRPRVKRTPPVVVTSVAATSGQPIQQNIVAPPAKVGWWRHWRTIVWLKRIILLLFKISILGLVIAVIIIYILPLLPWSYFFEALLVGVIGLIGIFIVIGSTPTLPYSKVPWLKVLALVLMLAISAVFISPIASGLWSETKTEIAKIDWRIPVWEWLKGIYRGIIDPLEQMRNSGSENQRQSQTQNESKTDNQRADNDSAIHQKNEVITSTSATTAEDFSEQTNGLFVDLTDYRVVSDSTRIEQSVNGSVTGFSFTTKGVNGTRVTTAICGPDSNQELLCELKTWEPVSGQLLYEAKAFLYPVAGFESVFTGPYYYEETAKVILLASNQSSYREYLSTR